MFPHSSCLSRCILRVLCRSLNSPNGEGGGCDDECSEFQETVLRSLWEDCERVSKWEVRENLPSWHEFFQVKGIDYKGDEVLTARQMQWANVAPALPEEVNYLGCRHYVMNFEDYLFPEEDQVE